MDFAPLLLLGVDFDSDPVEEEEDEYVDPDEVETDVLGESLVEDVLESGSASLKILASGEFGGRFNIPENNIGQRRYNIGTNNTDVIS